MRTCFSVMLVAGLLLFAGCASNPVPNRPSPLAVTVLREVRLVDDARPQFAAAFLIPPGKYELVRDDGNWVYFLNRNAEIRKSWTKVKRADRMRPGGFALQKKSGVWWLFSLGTKDDLFEDGMPDLGLLLAKADFEGKYYNQLALIGRYDANGNISVYMPSYGHLEDYTAIELH